MPLDVGVRRIQLDWYVIKSWLGIGQKRGGSTQTMGALLERKQAVGSQIEARRGDSPLPTEALKRLAKPQARGGGTANRPPPMTGPALQKTQEDDKTTTTERLLKLKRKRQQDP